MLLTHLATSAVMDLLLRLITCVDGMENKQNILTVTFLSLSESWHFKLIIFPVA